MAALQRLGFGVAMLTGDNARTAEAIARETGKQAGPALMRGAVTGRGVAAERDGDHHR